MAFLLTKRLFNTLILMVSELTKEQIMVGADIYRGLIKQVEALIKEEDFEGQKYNAI